MDLQGDIAATQELAASVRDTTEQLNRNVNTSVVVLTKIDALRDVLIGLDAKIGTMGK
jgi:ABC-type transporter Mla subunit MlaD